MVGVPGDGARTGAGGRRLVVADEQALNALPVETVEAVLFTDPLCSWSWAFEAPARRLRYEFGERLAWRTALGGLLPDWASFSDPLNDVTRPAQMGPSWKEVHHLSGMPIDELIWLVDPPESSYPASVAAKAAELQGAAAGEAYLRRLREAVMLERRNIARREVLFSLADELAGRQHRENRENRASTPRASARTWTGRRPWTPFART